MLFRTYVREDNKPSRQLQLIMKKKRKTRPLGVGGRHNHLKWHTPRLR